MTSVIQNFDRKKGKIKNLSLLEYNVLFIKKIILSKKAPLQKID